MRIGMGEGGRAKCLEERITSELSNSSQNAAFLLAATVFAPGHRLLIL